jgi:bifunctional ADP-heptose synthase (sugar kinase/adenylyltransferase)
MYTNEELEVLTSKWAADRGITTNGKVITQCMKLMEELGEMASHIAKGQPIEDDIGDCVVVLNNIARLSGTTLNICWNVAYEDIKDRKGFLTEDDIKFIAEKHPLVIVDTKKKLGVWCKDIRFIKINRTEYLNNVDVIDIIDWLDEKLLITLDKDGTVHKGIQYPAEEVEVVDICGAGDTFIAGFTKEYIQTQNIETSILFANKVAASVIQHKGVSVYC